jgi:endonuclease-3
MKKNSGRENTEKIVGKKPRAPVSPAKSKKGAAPAAKRPHQKGKAKAQHTVSPSTAQKMIDELCKLYPDASCELDYDTPFQLLVATILSAQTTDVVVNKVTKELFKRFGNPRALAEADLNEVKEIIKPTGYYNAKATNIQNCAQAIVAKFGGEVPKTQAELTTLPGVGVKTANVVLGEAYDIPGWTVDTHVQRLSHRLGLSTHSDPLKIERDLQNLFPKADWSKLSITLIWHGRRMCFARKPNCQSCPINQLCPSSLVL